MDAMLLATLASELLGGGAASAHPEAQLAMFGGGPGGAGRMGGGAARRAALTWRALRRAVAEMDAPTGALGGLPLPTLVHTPPQRGPWPSHSRRHKRWRPAHGTRGPWPGAGQPGGPGRLPGDHRVAPLPSLPPPAVVLIRRADRLLCSSHEAYAAFSESWGDADAEALLLEDGGHPHAPVVVVASAALPEAGEPPALRCAVLPHQHGAAQRVAKTAAIGRQRACSRAA